MTLEGGPEPGSREAINTWLAKSAEVLDIVDRVFPEPDPGYNGKFAGIPITPGPDLLQGEEWLPDSVVRRINGSCQLTEMPDGVGALALDEPATRPPYISARERDRLGELEFDAQREFEIKVFAGFVTLGMFAGGLIMWRISRHTKK